jgi:hypothetical protein
MSAKYTIFLPISRPWVLDMWETNLRQLKFPHAECEVIIAVDTNDQEFFKLVEQSAGRVEGTKPFYDLQVLMSGREALADDALILARRQRVIDIWNFSKEYFRDTTILFSLEDDTLCPNTAFNKLIKMIKPGVGFASGVQAHRLMNNPLGAWLITKEEVKTIPYLESSIQEVDGSGIFCFATPTKLIKKIDFRQGDAPFGPDVCLVQDIKKKKLRALVDFDVKCPHILKDRTKIFPWESKGIIGYTLKEKEWTPYTLQNSL